jgi:alpha-1,3-rhamnosyl/mannosyltransferase
MACGAPVVCSRASSLPEIGGDDARYFNPDDVPAMADAILAVWHNAELRESLRRRGLARAAQFSWARAAKETLAVYTQAAQATL